MHWFPKGRRCIRWENANWIAGISKPPVCNQFANSFILAVYCLLLDQLNDLNVATNSWFTKYEMETDWSSCRSWQVPQLHADIDLQSTPSTGTLHTCCTDVSTGLKHKGGLPLYTQLSPPILCYTKTGYCCHGSILISCRYPRKMSQPHQYTQGGNVGYWCGRRGDSLT